MKFKEIFYVANIIDYWRIITLYWAYQATGTTFVTWYAISYILDCVDGYAARLLNQESRLGYYLDMVIDRASSCMCLHFAATAVLSGKTFVPASISPTVALTLRGLMVMVELVAHGTVMYLSEVLGVHQKQMGYDYTIVKLYLSDKRFLGWSCFSFEGFGLGLIMNSAPLALLSLPGFVFRAVANLARLLAIVSKKDQEKVKWPEEQRGDGELPRRGSSDRLGDHRAASPRSAQVIRRRADSGSGSSSRGRSSSPFDKKEE